jgi:hypothetical protein
MATLRGPDLGWPRAAAPRRPPVRSRLCLLPESAANKTMAAAVAAYPEGTVNRFVLVSNGEYNVDDETCRVSLFCAVQTRREWFRFVLSGMPCVCDPARGRVLLDGT